MAAQGSRKGRWRGWRPLALLLLCALALQLYFLARIALMAVVDPQSTSFQRSEAWRLLVEQHRIAWRQEWVDDARLSPQLKRAVIASEDAGFTEHSGVEWDAIEQAWEKNQRAEAAAARRNAQLERRSAATGAAPRPPAARPAAVPKVVGGSTITQQLAKNLFLSGERTALRKAQELVLTYELEALLGKRRILTLYLNHVEWGEGVFGAQAAAQHYFRTDAARLDAGAAARLAVMLPAPKRFEKNPGSAYVAGRSATIVARMGAVELP
jgi:monofunctional biosynthetic peptidoglycan transglycosylase